MVPITVSARQPERHQDRHQGRLPEGRSELLAVRCFVVGVAGLPLWWVLGIGSVVPLLLVLPLGRDLRRRGRVRLPPHIGWWFLFLVWAAIGVGTLWAAAPGAVADGGAGRLLVFGYRLAWYLACTVVLVWLGNTSVDRLPDQVVRRVLAAVFVVAVAGGLLGLLAPDLTITTLAERVLPGGLRSNGFVSTLVSAEAADVQQVLGDAEPRPKAPFAYTNTWGSVMSLTLVFFVAAALRSRSRLRWLAAPVLALATIPIVMSLNRGLWLALAADAVGLVVLLLVRRKYDALVALFAIAAILVGAVLTTSLGTTINERLDHPHSNERRSQLLETTVSSMTDGSPVVGFGSTRDVAGSFASIAGGATPDCPACGVPPLGTQGQLWLVLFSQGWFGTLFFLTFFVLALQRSWRCQSLNQTVATFVVGVFLLQLTVYDTLGLPLFIVMIAIGLVWREQRSDAASRGPAGPERNLRRPSSPTLLLVAAGCTVGAVVGVAMTWHPPAEFVSTATVELTPAPTYLDTGEQEDPAELAAGQVPEAPVPATVDTEAALLLSDHALRLAGTQVDIAADTLRNAIQISAPPLSTVLTVSVTTDAGRDPAAAAAAVSTEYLAARGRVLESLRTSLIGRLDERLRGIDPRDPAWAQTRAYLRRAVDHLRTDRQRVGSVLRIDPAHRVRVDRSVPLTSGIALGGLLGLIIARTRDVLATRRRQ